METQYLTSTCQLVDTWDEQALLEDLIETSKPALPPAFPSGPASGVSRRSGSRKSGREPLTRHPDPPPRHYLLTTPFRYTPQHASRFRPVGGFGIWYGAATFDAACAEVAYWRRRFIRDSEGLADTRLTTSHTFFAAAVHGLGIDLMAEPWSRWRAAWTSDGYAQTHRLAQAVQSARLAAHVVALGVKEARGAQVTQAVDIQVLRYESARAFGQACFAVFTPEVLAEPLAGLETTFRKWTCVASGDVALMFDEMEPSRRLTFGEEGST